MQNTNATQAAEDARIEATLSPEGKASLERRRLDDEEEAYREDAERCECMGLPPAGALTLAEETEAADPLRADGVALSDAYTDGAP
jgi:hypothetical protein